MNRGPRIELRFLNLFETSPTQSTMYVRAFDFRPVDLFDKAYSYKKGARGLPFPFFSMKLTRYGKNLHSKY